MSARLINPPDHGVEHNFRDDLESSLYVLLWTTLMYSEVSHWHKNWVSSFLASVLDPQSYDGDGSCGKQDFLKGQTFLSQVNFPNRPALHELVYNLADLFQFRYELAPTESQKEGHNELQALVGESSRLYQAHYCTEYYRSMDKLKNHAATIELFETALSDRSKWPANDCSVKQVFGPRPPTEPVLKTRWRSTGYF
jgi:hypothetical protein